MSIEPRQQFNRRCNVIVASDAGAGLDFSTLRIKFAIKKADAQTPNTAAVRIYNVAPDTATRLRKEFTSLSIQAGYAHNIGIVFSGTIKQVRLGRENGVDAYVDIEAADGDVAYNGAVVSKTLSAGSTQHDQIDAATAPMQALGLQTGAKPAGGAPKLPRGKTMYGMARDYLRHSADATLSSWSIQDGVIQFVPLTGVLPFELIVLNSKTGLVGTPEQTGDGIKVRCLLNPLLKVGGKVQVNEQDVAQAALPDTTKKAPVNKPAAIQHDGVYRLYVVEHNGDTHGSEWYSDVVCLGVFEANPIGSKVKING